MLKKLLKTIADPGSEFRGAPFWAWNGKLEEEELREQIRMMKEMGLGGFFMHSRVGLDTPYLSDEWFHLVGACIDEAKAELNGVTLESLVVAVRVARAVRVLAAKGLADPAEFPLLTHVDDILEKKVPVSIPWESFTFEKL